MTQKIKVNQSVTPNEVQGRDLFQTPNYAVDLLIPFIPKEVKVIWECACGEGKITSVLENNGFKVMSTDLAKKENYMPDFFINFIEKQKLDISYFEPKLEVIITNPPFSLKKQFYERCLEYNIPFALLIPADYSGWIIKATQNGAEKIIPTRRIDYITPTGLSGETNHTANFHSMWLTKGFNLGRTETFVELTNKMKENI